MASGDASFCGEHVLVACPASLPDLVEVEGRARWPSRPSSERVFTLDGRHGRIGAFGSWGCQVSTGLRDRRSQVEVARRPRKTAGKPVTGKNSYALAA